MLRCVFVRFIPLYTRIRCFYPGTAVRYCSSLFLLIALISPSLSVSASFDIFGSGSPAGRECLACPATAPAAEGDAGMATGTARGEQAVPGGGGGTRFTII